MHGLSSVAFFLFRRERWEGKELWSRTVENRERDFAANECLELSEPDPEWNFPLSQTSIAVIRLGLIEWGTKTADRKNLAYRARC